MTREARKECGVLLTCSQAGHCGGQLQLVPPLAPCALVFRGRAGGKGSPPPALSSGAPRRWCRQTRSLRTGGFLVLESEEDDTRRGRSEDRTEDGPTAAGENDRAVPPDPGQPPLPKRGRGTANGVATIPPGNRPHTSHSRARVYRSLLNDMLVFKHPGIIIRVYGFKIFVLKNGTARCTFS